MGVSEHGASGPFLTGKRGGPMFSKRLPRYRSSGNKADLVGLQSGVAIKHRCFDVGFVQMM